ncbi:MAG: hypothetical protein ACK4YP_01630 [Myxococcota bacterium]
MRLAPVVLLQLVALLACAAPGGEEDDDKPGRDGEADADTDADTDADSDADSDTDTDVDVAPCGRYTSAHLVGSEAVHRYTDEAEELFGYGGTYTNVTESYDPTSGEVVFSSETTLTGSSYRYYESTSTSVARCDTDGVWMESYYTEWAYETADGYTGSGWQEVTYDEGYLTMPSGVSVGDTWTASGTYRYDGSSGGGSYAYDVDYEVVDEASKTVPAGTYAALRVRSTVSSSESDFWVAPNIGTVATDYAELERWTP